VDWLFLWHAVVIVALLGALGVMIKMWHG